MKFKIIFSVFLISISAYSCDNQRTIRTYEEVTINPQPSNVKDPHEGMMMNRGMDFQSQDSSMQEMLTNSMANADLSWTVPNGWTEQKGSGMRMATFTSTGENAIECSIVTLSGASRGLEANIQRWLGQLSFDLSTEEFENFMSSQKEIASQSGLKIRLIDFRPLSSSKDNQESSIMAGVIESDEKTIFIKLTGTLEAINLNDEKFMGLLTSLRLTNE